MWHKSHLFNNWFYHFWYWPRLFIVALVSFYILFITSLFLLYQNEKNDRSEFYYYKALDARKRELNNLKLAGLEPYLWRPAFDCNSLSEEKNSTDNKKECFKTSIRFTSLPENDAVGKYVEKSEGFSTIEKPVRACFICHPKEAGKVVEWNFAYKIKKPENYYTSIWLSRDFLYFNGIVAGLLAMYLVIRLIRRYTGKDTMVAVAIKGSRENMSLIFTDKVLKKYRKKFYYVEIGNTYIRGYIPRNHFFYLLKFYFTSKVVLGDRSIQIGALEYNSNSFNFEGLRLAQAIASKAPENMLLVQDTIEIPFPSDEKSRKAVWKTGDKTFGFKVVGL